MLSVGNGTRVEAMESLLGIESIETRRKVLRAKFLERTHRDRNHRGFAIYHAREEYGKSQKMRQYSCLYEKAKKKELWRQLCVEKDSEDKSGQRRMAGTTRQEKQKYFAAMLEEWKRQERAKKYGAILPRYSNCREGARKLLRRMFQKDKGMERRWLLWMLKKWPAKPRACKVCGMAKNLSGHFEEHLDFSQRYHGEVTDGVEVTDSKMDNMINQLISMHETQRRSGDEVTVEQKINQADGLLQQMEHIWGD